VEESLFLIPCARGTKDHLVEGNPVLRQEAPLGLDTYLDRFRDQRVLVVGDIILDHYIQGDVSRTSPEAPVPVLAVEREEWLPGGAANVAKNLTALGARADLVGLVGSDDAARKLKELLKADKLLRPRLVTERGRPTTLKTRCVSQGQQMLRFDHEVAGPVAITTEQAALERIEGCLEQCSGVIISDYGKGFLQPKFLQAVIGLVTARGLKVLVDPKGRDYTRYRGASLVTPNQKEASESTGVAIIDMKSVEEAARKLHRTIRGEAIVITRGGAGLSVFPRRGKPSHIPARAREVYDVTGAGDTVIASLGLGIFSGASFAEAGAIGNLAAGIVVGRAGVASVSLDTLRVACEEEEDHPRRKLVSAAELEQICRSLRQNGRKVIFTNGFFDVLHPGHVRLLSEARKLGHSLIVAVNSDASTRRLKGEPRPILKIGERVDIIAALPSVDYVTIFDGDTPEDLLARLRPDVLVKGGGVGAKKKDVVGAPFVESYGGEVRLIELKDMPRISTILERASNSSRKKKKTRKKR